MNCRFCENELTPDMLRSKGCGACGRGGCRKIHCPYCGQENPLDGQEGAWKLGFAKDLPRDDE